MSAELSGNQKVAKGRLKWDARLVAGGTPSTNEASYWTNYGALDGTPFVAIADMSDRVRIDATNKALTNAGMQSRNMPVGDPGTLLLAMYASVGEVSLLGIQATWNQALLGITPDPRHVDTQYLRYVLLAMRPELLRDVRSTTQDNLNAGQIGDIWYPKPPLGEQRAIADFLDQETAQIDSLVAKQEELIGLLRERRTSVRREALTPYPDWNRTRIKQLAKTNLGKMLDAGRKPRLGDFSAPYVRAADVLADGSIRLENLNEMPFSSREMSFFDLRRNDILIIEGGATVGRPGFVNVDVPGVAFQKTVNRLRPGPNLDPRFAYWSMVELYEADYYANYFGAVSFVHLTGEKLREISLMHPSVDVQRRIGCLIDERTARIDTLIAKAEEHIALAKERRAALITAAVTGQFDVRTARKAG